MAIPSPDDPTPGAAICTWPEDKLTPLLTTQLHAFAGVQIGPTIADELEDDEELPDDDELEDELLLEDELDDDELDDDELLLLDDEDELLLEEDELEDEEPLLLLDDDELEDEELLLDEELDDITVLLPNFRSLE